MVGWLVGWFGLFGWFGWLVGWLVGWSVGWLVGRLLGWLEVLIDFRPDYASNDPCKADPYIMFCFPFLWTPSLNDFICAHSVGRSKPAGMLGQCSAVVDIRPVLCDSGC